MSEKKNLKPKDQPEAPSKPVPKDKPVEAKEEKKFRPGVNIKPTFHKIQDEFDGETRYRNCVTLASSKTRLAEMGLYCDMDPTPEKRFILTISIPSSVDGEQTNMSLDRSLEEAQALFNAFPRRIPDWEIPGGCGLVPPPERPRKKRKAKDQD